MQHDRMQADLHSWWALSGLLALVVTASAIVFLAMRRSSRRAMRRLFDREAAQAKTIGHRASAGLVGMPSLQGMVRQIGGAERIPPWLFYAPLGLNWLWLGIRHRSLSLPSLANPVIEVGGLWGESKRVYLDMIGGGLERWVARYVALDRHKGDAAPDIARALAAVRQAGIGFPLVAKPDIGWQGYGVRLIGSEAELADYIAAFPEGATFLLQERIDWDGEAGVFYSRLPGDEEGRVTAVTLRYFPHVVGDGARSVRDLILAERRTAWKAGLHMGLGKGHSGLDEALLGRVPQAGEVVRLSFIGSIRVGGIYRDAPQLVTPQLSARFDAIARGMQEFYYGRFDIRFASSERLALGEDFRIIEVNGAGSEAISAWDPDTPIMQVYARLRAHQRLMFEIGARNRERGWKPAGAWQLARAAWRQTRLINRYPPSS